MGDERCVPRSHIDSNSGMVERVLFKNGISTKSRFYPVSCQSLEDKDYLIEYALKAKSPDIILLGVGRDGHIASIFPENFNLNDLRSGYEVVQSKSYNHKRITVMPGTIKNCARVIVLARDKLSIYKMISAGGSCLPAIIVKEKVWIF